MVFYDKTNDVLDTITETMDKTVHQRSFSSPILLSFEEMFCKKKPMNPKHHFTSIKSLGECRFESPLPLNTTIGDDISNFTSRRAAGAGGRLYSGRRQRTDLREGRPAAKALFRSGGDPRGHRHLRRALPGLEQRDPLGRRRAATELRRARRAGHPLRLPRACRPTANRPCNSRSTWSMGSTRKAARFSALRAARRPRR